MLGLGTSISNPIYFKNILHEFDFSSFSDFVELDSSVDTFIETAGGFVSADASQWTIHTDGGGTSGIFDPTVSAATGTTHIQVTFNIIISLLTDSFKVCLAENTDGSERNVTIKEFTSPTEDGYYDVTVSKHNLYRYIVIQDTHDETSGSTATISLTNLKVRYIKE